MISNRILKAASLPAAILKVSRQLHQQKKFIEGHISPLINTSMSTNDGSLETDDILKIYRYYGLAVPAILGEAFAALRGSPMTNKERWASTAQGAMTGLFDDFFDKDYLEENAISAMIDDGETSSNKRSNEKLFDVFYRLVLQNVEDQKYVKTALREVYHAQVESKKQKNGLLGNDQLLKLTLFKGGSSVLFYRSAFAPAPSKGEWELLNNLGGLMQLANDLFDVYKDREAHIQTLITDTKHIGLIRDYMRTHLQQFYTSAYKIGFASKNVKRFLDIISIGIFSRCFVCFDQLEQNERQSNNVFQVQLYARKQLICDMEKKINLLRAAKYYTKM